MNTSMNTIVEDISIERLDTIDREREMVYADPDFQQWCKDMKIGYMIQKREGIMRANDMMAQWSGPLREGERLWPEWVRRMY